MADDNITKFLSEGPFAVVGASTNRAKYGNKVLRCYLQNNLKSFPVNPRADEIEGETCYPNLRSLPEKPNGISIILPPALGLEIVKEANKLGISNVWFQPGAESKEATEYGINAEMNIISDGSCLLVVLGYSEN